MLNLLKIFWNDGGKDALVSAEIAGPGDILCRAEA